MKRDGGDMKRHIILAAMAAVLLLPSCVSLRDESRSMFNPRNVRLEIGMQDLSWIGDTTLTVEYTKYWATKRITKVNGESYNPRFQREMTWLNNGDMLPADSEIGKAAYKLTELYPEGEYFLPVSHRVEKEYMTGGMYVRETLRVKVYRLK